MSFELSSVKELLFANLSNRLFKKYFNASIIFNSHNKSSWLAYLAKSIWLNYKVIANKTFVSEDYKRTNYNSKDIFSTVYVLFTDDLSTNYPHSLMTFEQKVRYWFFLSLQKRVCIFWVFVFSKVEVTRRLVGMHLNI